VSAGAQRSAETPTAAAGPPERADAAVSASLEFRLLGPLEVRRGGEPLALGGARPRALLACLLLGRGRVVSVDELVDGLWGESPPRTARHMVEVYVSKLRKRLDSGVLLTRPPGYLLQPERQRVDVERFERLLGEGAEALARSDASRASASLAAALALWRGPALADFTYEPFAQAEIARLEELRLVALEERVEADLALGQHAELIGELEALVAKHPYRERPRGQLMLALYRAGRQADALAAYRSARETLVEELGVKPGPELRRLEQAILAQEEWLTGPRALTRRPIEIRETRRLLTVLFAQPAGDDPVLAEADLEALQPHARRWLQGAEDVLVRHGATVERLPEGTLMGLFGSPIAHEDDALRSLRAAVGLRELEIVSRVGVDTGEVLAGGDPLVSGPVVRAARRLLAAAPPGQVLVGEATRRLALGSARFEPLEGDGEDAWRLLDVVAGAPVRALRLDAPLVGRETELAELVEVFTQTVRDRRPHLVTVIGEPGIGKTRLAREFGERVEDETRILTGRCLAYGEGITYWPLREVMGELAGEESAEALGALVASVGESEEIARRLAAAVGFLDEVHPVEEIRWAARRLFEALARERPLLLIFDDVHWAESAFLDLLRHVLELGRDAPILLLCLARGDLFEEHPDWVDPDERTSTLTLAALAPADAEKLVTKLDPLGALSHGRREHAIHAAEGNPLFLEQLVAFATETRRNGAELELPPTLEALLAARLDRFGPAERAVLECAAVVGREFWTNAVRELLPPEALAALPRHLDALRSKELIEPDTPTLPFEDAFRFRHVLIRDAAYRGIPKETRASLHARFANWLESRAGPDEEIVGYHLEQAYRYRVELGPVDDDAARVAARAGLMLAAAGQQAVHRGDPAAAAKLLERAATLVPLNRLERLDTLLALGSVLTPIGKPDQAQAVLDEAINAARMVGDRGREWRARLERSFWRAHVDPALSSEDLLREAQQAIVALKQVGDEQAVARAWRAQAQALFWLGRGGAAAAAAQNAIDFAERSGDAQARSWSTGTLMPRLSAGRPPRPWRSGDARRFSRRPTQGRNLPLTPSANSRRST
jgi:DNA-binding SARP family transcriptional activator